MSVSPSLALPLVCLCALSACQLQPVVSQSSESADTQIGPIMECGLGDILTDFCEDWSRLAFGAASPYGWFVRRICNTSVEAFATCSGLPGTPGVHCEVCAGINNDIVEADFGLASATLEGGLLYCYSWDTERGLDSGEGHLVQFAGGVADLGTPQAGVSLSCGGYDTIGADRAHGSGYYCSGTAYFDFTHVGVPLKCELGIIFIDPQQLLAEIKKFWDYDPVAVNGPDPAHISVACNPNESQSTLLQRCRQAAATVDSGIDSSFGYAVSCEDVWQNQCSLFTDCPEVGRRECDHVVDSCVERSRPNCSTATAPAAAEVRVPCFRGDSVIEIEDRCYAAIAPRDSTATSRFGRALSCDVVWKNQCYLFGDCPETAVADCDARVDSCVHESWAVCRQGERS